MKPSNLILESTPGPGASTSRRLRVLDFGLARLEGQESLTLSGDLIGTVLYMSPEQAMARRIPLDHRTDIYSLGVTLYEMLTCQPPFRGRNYQDTLSQIILRDPRSPRQLNPSIPKDLETIVLKCMRKDAKDRYGTAEALAQDLRRFARGEPIEARPRSGLEQLARKAWRYRGRLALGIAVLIAVSLFLFITYREWDAQREQDYKQLTESALGKLQFEHGSRQRARGRVQPWQKTVGSGMGNERYLWE